MIEEALFDVDAIAARFWEKVEKSDGCWEWKGYRHTFGYGMMEVGSRHTNRKVCTAHRLSWQIHHGAIPSGLYVCHHCDNPPCVRPDHLYLGTQFDNMRDAFSRGRMAKRRQGRGNHRFTGQQAADIRARLANGERTLELAKELGVWPEAIRNIRIGRTYVRTDL